MAAGISAAGWIGIAAAGATLLSANAQANAASDAADAQVATSNADIAQRQQQFQSIQKMLQPYVDAGTSAIGKQGDLIGMGGSGAQQSAIQALQQSPYFQAMLKQGENSMMANASATGGLRGGNLQSALAQFSPSLLAQTIQQQYQNLGGIASLGQNAAAMTGNSGLATANGVGEAIKQQGASLAGAAMAGGRAQASMWNAPFTGYGLYRGLGGGNASTAEVPQSAVDAYNEIGNITF